MPKKKCLVSWHRFYICWSHGYFWERERERAQAQIYHALCDVPLLPLIFFSRSFPALFWEEGTKQPQEVCHFLADTASEEQAVSATEVLAPWKVCRQQFAEQPRYCRVSYCVFSCPLHRSPHSQPLPKSCSGTCLCLVKLILSYRIVVPKWWTAGVGEQAHSDHTAI